MPLLAKAKVVSNNEVAPDHFILSVETRDMARRARPGQFVHLSCGNGQSLILRRPFSFYSVEGEIVSFLYQVKGKGTGLLKNYSQGEEISILGPLGRGFSYKNNRRKKVVVAGGVGLAPFPFLIKDMILKAKIKPEDIILVYGARNKKFLVGLDRLRKLGISLWLSTDRGDKGFKGMATDLLINLLKKKPIENGDYYTCGPEKMMKKVVEIATNYGRGVQVCLEERMGCGVGACLSCVRKVSGQYLRICKDGPIFWGDEVEWEI